MGLLEACGENAYRGLGPFSSLFRHLSRVRHIVRQRHLSGKKKLGQKGHHLWVNLKHTSGKKQKHKKKMLTGESNYRVQ